MEHMIAGPWPWYIGGPLLGLCVPILLLLGNKQLGVSGCLRALCAAIAPGPVEFFRYDWKESGLWNIALAFGLFAGGFVAVSLIGTPTPDVATSTRAAIAALGLSAVSGPVPKELFSWQSLLTVRGLTCMLGGGFLVGFGAAYGGGCTSGHGVMGLATLQRASVVALLGMFAGGLIATWFLLPAIL